MAEFKGFIQLIKFFGPLNEVKPFLVNTLAFFTAKFIITAILKEITGKKAAKIQQT